jgi:hypothetical protein
MSEAIANPAGDIKRDDDDDEDVEQLQYKIILLGDGAVGS